ncbi:MAG: transposase [Saprospirales bacterium]|nr:transposase [Saprospirales bacterium]
MPKNQPDLSNHAAQRPKAAHLYAKRWKIECLFRHLKTNGYNLEDLNLKELNKSLLMMAIVTTAYILAIREGWKRRRRIPTQRYQDGSEAPGSVHFQRRPGNPNLQMLSLYRVLILRFHDLIPKKSCDLQKCPVVWQTTR